MVLFEEFVLFFEELVEFVLLLMLEKFDVEFEELVKFPVVLLLFVVPLFEEFRLLEFVGLVELEM